MHKSQPKLFDTKVAENSVVLIAARFKIRFCSNAVVLAVVIKLVFPRKSLLQRISSVPKHILSNSFPAVEVGTKSNLQLNIENLNDRMIQ